MSQEEAAKHVASLADALNQMAATLREPGNWIVVATQSTNQHDGYQIGYSDGQFQMKYIERLIVHDVMSTPTSDDVVYDAALTLVQTLAEEVRQRDPMPLQDYRRQTFPTELALLSKLPENWRARREREQAEELKRQPFVDPPTAEQQLDSTEFYYINSSLSRVLGRPRADSPDKRPAT
jgi:hypothetical protein